MTTPGAAIAACSGGPLPRRAPPHRGSPAVAPASFRNCLRLHPQRLTVPPNVQHSNMKFNTSSLSLSSYEIEKNRGTKAESSYLLQFSHEAHSVWIAHCVHLLRFHGFPLPEDISSCAPVR